jgi:molybdenum cofactor synthesis domain
VVKSKLMISVNHAKKLISERTSQSQPVDIPIQNATGFITARDVTSPIDVPPFDNSAMDGYAIKLNKDNYVYRITHIVQAGETRHLKIGDGEAARVFTGAPIPDGADTVVQQELSERNDDFVKLNLSEIDKGEHIRLRGAQSKSGTTILQKGTLISPGTVGLLASVGIQAVSVYSSPVVSVVITGNELTPPGSELDHGLIYESNSPALVSYLKYLGVHNINVFHAPDEKEWLKKKISECLDNSDILLLTGGVSVGDYDFVHEILNEIGIERLFHKVKQRPGKPLYVGKLNSKWVFGLPGNPASVISCFNQYVKPCIKANMGFTRVWEPDARLPLENRYTKKPGLTFFLKASTVNDKIVVPDGQQSFNMLPFGAANGLAEIPEEIEMVEPGSIVNFYKW